MNDRDRSDGADDTPVHSDGVQRVRRVLKMGGIRVFILRKDFTLGKRKIDSGDSHTHYNKGSYLNMEGGILKSPNKGDPPVLIFQEGNAVPKGAISRSAVDVPTEANNPQRPLESVKWETWYIPMLRGLNRGRREGGNFAASLGKVFNLKTFPFWLIVLALAWQFLGPILFPPAASPLPPSPPLP